MIQLSLFPDGSEHLQQAFQAFQRLELREAWAALERARALDARMLGLASLEAALVWLEERGIEHPPGAARAAELFAELGPACERGELERRTALSLSEILARHALRTVGAEVDLQGAAARVPGCVLRLALGQVDAAVGELRELLGEGEGRCRADLWAALGDARQSQERFEEASEAYVRALLLDAQALDLLRLRQPELAALHGVLAATHGSATARELLFPHGWLRGVLPLHAPDRVIEAELSHLRARAARGDPEAPQVRARLFSLMLYEDLVAGPTASDIVERRERMAELEPALFAELMRVRRAREERAPRRR